MQSLCESRRRRLRPAFPRRRGAATVEFAICFPVLVILVFGGVELANGIFLKQVLTTAAYEGARVAAQPTGTNTTAQARINAILAARSVQGGTSTFNPTISATLARGTRFTVTVTAPVSSNQLLPGWSKFTGNLSYSVVMVRQ